MLFTVPIGMSTCAIAAVDFLCTSAIAVPFLSVRLGEFLVYSVHVVCSGR